MENGSLLSVADASVSGPVLSSTFSLCQNLWKKLPLNKALASQLASTFVLCLLRIRIPSFFQTIAGQEKRGDPNAVVERHKG